VRHSDSNNHGGYYTPSVLVTVGRLVFESFGEDMLEDGDEVRAVWVAAAILWRGDVGVVSWAIACGTGACPLFARSLTPTRFDLSRRSRGAHWRLEQKNHLC
jgi:hypothetical protein